MSASVIHRPPSRRALCGVPGSITRCPLSSSSFFLSCCCLPPLLLLSSSSFVAVFLLSCSPRAGGPSNDDEPSSRAGLGTTSWSWRCERGREREVVGCGGGSWMETLSGRRSRFDSHRVLCQAVESSSWRSSHAITHHRLLRAAVLLLPDFVNSAAQSYAACRAW